MPFLYNSPHEVRPEHDVDWTLHADRNIELKRREERNRLIMDELLAGKDVVYRSSGWSLYPRVHSNDMCHYTPIRGDDDVEEDDVVFCQVRNMFFAHLVKRKEWYGCPDNVYSYTISRLDGRENGWTTIDKIYGKLVGVWH